MNRNEKIDISVFYPATMEIRGYENREEEIEIYIKSRTHEAKCPKCGEVSKTYHSTYEREIQDLPIIGKETKLKVTAYRYKCTNEKCGQKVFAEELEGFAGRNRWKTARLEEFIVILALQTSCESCSQVCEQIGIRVSRDSVISILKKHFKKHETICGDKIGVDDWAYRRGASYGTIICDGDTHKPVALLEGRDGESLKEWLKNNRHIRIVTRDRASALAAAIKEILPDAMQIADRFHLYKNLMDAVRATIIRELPENIPVCEDEKQDENNEFFEKSTISLSDFSNKFINDAEKKTIDENSAFSEKQPELTASEKSRREKIIKVQNLLKEGYSGTDIMKMLSTSARFIRTYKRGNPDELCRDWERAAPQKKKLEDYWEYITEQYMSGVKISVIYRNIVSMGCNVGDTCFYEYCRKSLLCYPLIK